MFALKVYWAEEAGDIKEIAKRLKDLRQERDEISARITTLKAERDIDIPEITPEALDMVFSTWRAEIEKATGKGDILVAKSLMAQFVSKIDLGREKAIIHYTFLLAIPSDSGQLLSAHRSPARLAGFSCLCWIGGFPCGDLRCASTSLLSVHRSPARLAGFFVVMDRGFPL